MEDWLCTWVVSAERALLVQKLDHFPLKRAGLGRPAKLRQFEYQRRRDTLAKHARGRRDTLASYLFCSAKERAALGEILRWYAEP